MIEKKISYSRINSLLWMDLEKGLGFRKMRRAKPCQQEITCRMFLFSFEWGVLSSIFVRNNNQRNNECTR